jgi:hypothetical protein
LGCGVKVEILVDGLICGFTGAGDTLEMKVKVRPPQPGGNQELRRAGADAAERRA